MTKITLPVILMSLFALGGTAFAQSVRDAIVTKSYEEAFGRSPSAGELSHWSGRKDWTTLSSLIDLHRQYIRGNADIQNQIVRKSYLTAFGREPNAGELNHWVGQAKNGTTYGEMVAGHRAFLAANPPAPAPNRDPWIGKAFQEVARRDPQGDEWDVKRYGNGHWSSYEDLVRKVRVRALNQGSAYIFIKPDQAVKQGHIGWGFMLGDGSYRYGSTENPMKEGLGGVWEALTIDPGKDNGYWEGTSNTEQEMFDDMKNVNDGRARPADRYPFGFRSSGYTHYKVTLVLSPNPSNAAEAGRHCQRTGFKGLGWNCLDQTYRVLEDYGVDKTTVMPWKQTHPSPNYWFNDFGGINPATRQAYKGNNTAGTPIPQATK